MQNIQAIVNGTSWSKRLTDQAINLHKMQIMRTKKPIRRKKKTRNRFTIQSMASFRAFGFFAVSLYLSFSVSISLSIFISLPLYIFAARTWESLEFTLAREQCVAYYANTLDSVTSPGNQIGVNMYAIYMYICYIGMYVCVPCMFRHLAHKTAPKRSPQITNQKSKIPQVSRW